MSRTSHQRIAIEQQLKERDIVKAKSVQTAEIDQQKAVQLAEQERAIAIAEKSRAQSEAQALADQARAAAVQAQEQVDTVREVERAERQKKTRRVSTCQGKAQTASSATPASQTEET